VRRGWCERNEGERGSGKKGTREEIKVEGGSDGEMKEERVEEEGRYVKT